MSPFPDGFHPYYCIVCGESWDDGFVHACKGPKVVESVLLMPSAVVNDLVLVGAEVMHPDPGLVEGLLDFPVCAPQSTTSEFRRLR